MQESEKKPKAVLSTFYRLYLSLFWPHGSFCSFFAKVVAEIKGPSFFMKKLLGPCGFLGIQARFALRMPMKTELVHLEGWWGGGGFIF